MIELNDLQKPSAAVLVIGAAAAAGFVTGFLFGRNPEAAQGLVRAVATGFTRLQVAAADAWENLGDAWADARAEAQRDIETERFAADASAEEPAPASTAEATTAVATAATGTGAPATPRRRRTRAVSKKAKKAAKPASRSAARRVPRRRATTAMAT